MKVLLRLRLIFPENFEAAPLRRVEAGVAVEEATIGLTATKSKSGWVFLSLVARANS